ncbi:hypothetical protein BDA99DRAFT_463108 [Phascolomyces articulosus]|uniref:Oxidoreductase AflY n=1 Tax=Phascolomyces articulosus TaxID=60185 RepID=A0AAD5K119_9FUNG|nr:hypothetical protein BDA99DRAFT_463108 [Phascolomyces articulosus]
MSLEKSDATTNLSHHAIHIPGTAPNNLTRHPLIDKCHKEFDIFFNNIGFHSHLMHHYLAAYALGASKERLQEIYDTHASYMRPIPDSVGIITRNTYRQELGNRNAYTSYLNFFTEEIKQFGMMETIRYWMFKDDMLTLVLGALYHPTIHLAYAAEFNLPKIASEALAMAACTDHRLVPLFGTLDQPLPSTLNKKNGTQSIYDIINRIRRDPDFDDVVHFSDQFKDRSVLENTKAVAKLREYASQWHFKDIESNLQELFIHWIFIEAATGIRKNHEVKLDFDLTHVLTSVHAVYTLVPHLTSTQAELLLSHYMLESLMYYVAQGRPPIEMDLLAEYKSPQAINGSDTPWLDVFRLALAAEEPHCIKAVRAIALAQIVYGSSDGNDQKEVEGSSSTFVTRKNQDLLFLKAAQLTVDVAGKGTAQMPNFVFTGIGYKETWE